MNFNIKKTVTTALFMAICCILTLIIQIPSPMNGYVNLGDCGVLLSAWILGPVYGGLAAGIGSMLADILSGYAYYAPGTLVIKAAMAVAAALICRKGKMGKSSSFPVRLFSGVVAEGIMVAGYLGYAALLLEKGVGAFASVPGNVVQGIFGILSGVIVLEALLRTGYFKD